MKEYKVQYWYQNRDDYDFDIVNTKALSPEEAILNVKEGRGYKQNGQQQIPPRGAKDFKIIWKQI